MDEFINQWRTALPSAMEAKPYVETVRRLSLLFSLLSICPVIAGCRFNRPLPDRKISDESRKRMKEAKAAKAKAAGKPVAAKADAEEEEDEEVEESEAAAVLRAQTPPPLGVLSVVLLIASELCQCWELFAPIVWKAKKATGPVAVLVETVKKAGASILTAKDYKKKGVMENAFAFIQGALSQSHILASVHGLVMLILLVICLCYVLQFMVLRPGKGMKYQAMVIFRGAALFLPVAIFGVAQSETILKVFKALAYSDVLDAMWLPLRAAALLCATPPQANEKGTSGYFAAFQVASLFGLISCELITDSHGIVKALIDFHARPNPAKLLGSPVLSILAPMVISIVWLYFTHLSRRPNALFFAVMCCCLSQPALLSAIWPKVALTLGMGKASDPAKLVNFLSVLYSGSFMMAILTGGTFSFVGFAVMSHLFSGIHGIENLTLMLEL